MVFGFLSPQRIGIAPNARFRTKTIGKPVDCARLSLLIGGADWFNGFGSRRQMAPKQISEIAG
jgi:hypothetical protein